MNQTLLIAMIFVAGVFGLLALWVEYRVREHSKTIAWASEKHAEHLATLEKIVQSDQRILRDQVTELKRQKQSDTTELHARIAELRGYADEEFAGKVGPRIEELETALAKSMQWGIETRDALGEYTEKLVAAEISEFSGRIVAIEDALRIKQTAKPEKKPSRPWAESRAAAEAGEAKIRAKADENQARKNEPSVH